MGCCGSGTTTGAYKLSLIDGEGTVLDLGVQVSRLGRVLANLALGWHREKRYGVWSVVSEYGGSQHDEGTLVVAPGGYQVKAPAT